MDWLSSMGIWVIESNYHSEFKDININIVALLDLFVDLQDTDSEQLPDYPVTRSFRLERT